MNNDSPASPEILPCKSMLDLQSRWLAKDIKATLVLLAELKEDHWWAEWMILNSLGDLDFSYRTVIATREKVAEILCRVNYVLPGLREKAPRNASNNAKIIYDLINWNENDYTSARSLPGYMRLLWEYLTAASHESFMSEETEKIAKELVEKIEYHEKRCREKCENEDPTVYLEYRADLIKSILNLAYYYARIAKYWDAKKYIVKGKEIAQLLSNAADYFNFIMLEVKIDMDKASFWSGGEEDIIKWKLETANLLFPEFARVYEKGEESEDYKMHEIEYDIFCLYHTVRFGSFETSQELAQVMRRYSELKAKDDILSLTEYQTLFAIQVRIYILIENFLSSYDWLEDKKEGDADLLYIIEQHNSLNQANEKSDWEMVNNGFDVDSYLIWSNAWLFLWCIIELFAHRVDSIEQARIHERKWRIAQALHMMVDIYELSWASRSEWEKISFLQQIYYPIFRDYSMKLFSSVDSTTDENNVLGTLDTLLAKRNESRIEYRNWILWESNWENITKDWVLQDTYWLSYEFHNVVAKLEGFKEEWQHVYFYIPYRWKIYKIRCKRVKNRNDSLEGKRKWEIERLFRELMPILLTDLVRWVKTKWDLDGSILDAMKPLGKPRDAQKFLDPAWYSESASRLDINDCSPKKVKESTGFPTILRVWDTDNSISISCVTWEKNESWYYGFIRLYIDRNKAAIFDLPPYKGIAMFYVDEKTNTVSFQNVVSHESNMSSTEENAMVKNYLQIIYKWYTIEEFPTADIILENERKVYGYDVGKIYNLWKLEWEAWIPDRTQLLAKIKFPDKDVQLLLTIHKEEDKCYIYIGSMATTETVNIQECGWILSYIISKALTKYNLTWTNKVLPQNIIVSWDRNGEYGKSWFNLNFTRFSRFWSGENPIPEEELSDNFIKLLLWI
jgi:hypothetical protein